jgi:hypothetical protein
VIDVASIGMPTVRQRAVTTRSCPPLTSIRKGNWIAVTPIPSQILESREMRLQGKDRELLLTLLRKILKWLPEERPSAEDLFEDGFILQFMSDDGSGAS